MFWGAEDLILVQIQMCLMFIFLGCIIDQATDYGGNDIKGGSKTTENHQECAVFSALTRGGLFWTWNKNTKKCLVKSSNSGKRKIGHAVSGNRECGIPGGWKTAKIKPFRFSNITRCAPGQP